MVRRTHRQGGPAARIAGFAAAYGDPAVVAAISGASSLIQVADVGLQMAKRAGRNQIVAA